jgi:hypothetical protein
MTSLATCPRIESSVVEAENIHWKYICIESHVQKIDNEIEHW